MPVFYCSQIGRTKGIISVVSLVPPSSLNYLNSNMVLLIAIMRATRFTLVEIVQHCVDYEGINSSARYLFKVQYKYLVTGNIEL